MYGYTFAQANIPTLKATCMNVVPSNTLNTSVRNVWNFDNVATDSVGSINATLMNGCTYSTGKLNQALIFDGVNDYALLADNSMNLSGDFAISVWVYHTASGGQVIFSNEIYQTTPSNIYKGFSLCIDNLSVTTNKVCFIIPKGTTTTYTGWEFATSSLTQNAWNHIFIQRVASTNTYCWVNNVSQSYTLRGTGADITFNPTYHTTQYCSIGAEKYASASVANYMKANSKIDALTIWNRTLTTAERNDLYNSGLGKQYLFV